jgi:hypothetical protein
MAHLVPTIAQPKRLLFSQNVWTRRLLCGWQTNGAGLMKLIKWRASYEFGYWTQVTPAEAADLNGATIGGQCQCGANRGRVKSIAGT